MRRPDGRTRVRLGGVLTAVALGAVAMLALPGIGATKDRDGHGGPPTAGTIESFDAETGLLVVDLEEGRQIAGLVVRRTHIRCGEGRRWRRHPRRTRRRGHPHAASASAPGRARADERGDAAGAVGRPAEKRDPAEAPPGRDGTPPGASEDPGRGAERSARCIDQLVPGAVVRRAEIVLAFGNAYFKKLGVVATEEPTP